MIVTTVNGSIVDLSRALIIQIRIDKVKVPTGGHRQRYCVVADFGHTQIVLSGHAERTQAEYTLKCLANRFEAKPISRFFEPGDAGEDLI